ncbi:hypothetical protein PsorP6_002049 [Peronosclerospora sorghi]|uniref:Uncharacterized protein n=1 Tax=Peronosclerospora sorghi TaxID=230839 RepID=A0ACC0WRZ2_9STRA|nr:hypothetical protein PsorP6_002049 [Peronosclerospora sorghi]
MYVFFGKWIGKAIFEGFLLNVLLSIPLLKRLLGVPIKVSNLYLLDETVLVYDVDSLACEHDHPRLNLVVEDTNIRAKITGIMDGLLSILSDNVLHVLDFKEIDLKKFTETRFEQSNHEFNLIGWFWEIVESFSQCRRGRLLHYVTVLSGVSVRGLAGMDSQIQLFTIHWQLGSNRIKCSGVKTNQHKTSKRRRNMKEMTPPKILRSLDGYAKDSGLTILSKKMKLIS